MLIKAEELAKNFAFLCPQPLFILVLFQLFCLRFNEYFVVIIDPFFKIIYPSELRFAQN